MGKQFNDMILRKVADFKASTKRLKEKSPYYPQVLIEHEGRDYQGHDFVATTLVRKEWEGRWYTIHCVQRHHVRESNITLAEEIATGRLLRQLIGLVHNTLHLYIITGKHEDIDTLQQSETDRLKETLILK